jgi:3-methylcrotonyl-CoA carboxylase alpha subunit
MFDTILIANRGEIACRIIRTAKRLGVRTVAVYSDADADALHVALADAAFAIGPAPARDSYLDGEKILAAARAGGAQAIHPGYGFLSENAGFAEACAAAGVTFIGPPASAIRAMGGKSEAKALMATAGVPLTPGYHGEAQDAALLRAEAEGIGFPVLIKASAGGGGKGMKIVERAADFDAALASGQREAASSFGDARVLIEAYLAAPRHVEVQVFADAHGTCLSLFERDCSIQRRHQKVLEEAPAPDLPAAVRRAMGEAAVTAARAIGYVGAGTIEFLYDPKTGAFYFMEMNTRLQVEHPVTEMITGLDLVEWQLRVAAGERLPFTQDGLLANGHAIEVRLYAEDPARDFLPQTGRIATLAYPEPSAHVRIDGGVRAGDTVSIHYDPMIAKLIVWDADRPAAIRRLREALRETAVLGLISNRDFLARLVGHPAFAAGELDTGFIARHIADLCPPPAAAPAELVAFAALGLLCARRDAAAAMAASSGDPTSPWGQASGFRLNGRAQTHLLFEDGSGVRHDVAVTYQRDRYAVEVDGLTFVADATLDADGTLHIRHAALRKTARWYRDGAAITVLHADAAVRLRHIDPLAPRAASAAAAGGVTSPMPGRVVAVLVAAGDTVAAGQPLVVVEAMKMEHAIKAPAAGIVTAVRFKPGDQVGDGEALVTFEAG